MFLTPPPKKSTKIYLALAGGDYSFSQAALGESPRKEGKKTKMSEGNGEEGRLEGKTGI